MTHEITVNDQHHVTVIGDVNELEAHEIASIAIDRPIYWSDDRRCHWMFDFKVGEHWCTGMFNNNGLMDDPNEFDPLRVRVA